VASYAQHRGDIRLVLTVMLMPMMDGSATIRALRNMDAQVKIIAVSGLTAGERAAVIAGSGASTFIHKPYTAERLIKTVQEALATD
jgi:two-component system, cell cycle sensor histidine kinase and response regulator CckA